MELRNTSILTFNNNSLSSARALKRINRDYEELLNNPLEGVGIIKNFDDDFKYYINLKMLHGIYEGVIIQLEMDIPHSYPVNPPKLRIMPGQPFNHEFHHHIF